MAPFFARLALKFEKSTNKILKIFLTKKKYQKLRNFILISNPLKKIYKNAQKKIISNTSLTNMSKSGKSAYFHYETAQQLEFNHATINGLVQPSY